MTKIKNIFKCVASIFLVLLVTLCIYTFIVTDIMKKDYVNIFGHTYFVVASGSMSGSIEVDDIIFVRLTKDVHLNDIITYKSKDGEIITHRLIQINNEDYIAKGDVNNSVDEAISKDQIIGKVSCSISPSFILKSIAVFLIIFIFLALVNFDGIVRKIIIKEKDTKKAEKDEQKKVPDDIFLSPTNRKEEPPSGLTVTIPLQEIETLEKNHEQELEKTSDIEILDDIESSLHENVCGNDHFKEKETIDIVTSILKCKRSQVFKTRMTKKWLQKYQYIFKLCNILLVSDTKYFVEEINNPPFQELYELRLVSRTSYTQKQ